MQRSLWIGLLAAWALAGCGDEELTPDAGPADAGAPMDAGPADTGAPDTGRDAGVEDAGGEDAGGEDAGGEDAFAFDHGVASGDPLSDRVVLWTRVTPGDESVTSVEVGWEIAEDDAFVTVVGSGTVETTTARDLTVKVDATGLAAGTRYFYRFTAGEVVSPVGRTKTLPLGPVDRVRLAIVSCSHYSAGFFNVYRLIANRSSPTDDLDAVVHLGDYFYEYGAGEYGDNGIAGREPIPPTEVFTLEGYRQRHAQYKSDLDLQALHQTHPMIPVWDDHESANDAWTGGAENHTPVEEGEWGVREQAARQAYEEWMPIRTPDMGGSIFRRFEFGTLATLHMLDTRLEGREEQLDYTQFVDDQQGFLTTFNDPDRSLLGMEQEAWLFDGLRNATTTWQVIGNQVMMGQLYNPQVPNPTNDPNIALANMLAMAGDQLAAAGLIPGPGLPFSLDAWDGYVAARERLFQVLATVRNPVVVTGDFHNAWALELARDADLRADGAYDPETSAGAVAVEFITSSVTSPGFEGALPDLFLDPILLAIQGKNPHIDYADLRRRGFLELTLSSSEAQARFVFSPSIAEPSADELVGRSYTVAAGTKRLVAD